jgi:hypothetical protein
VAWPAFDGGVTALAAAALGAAPVAATGSEGRSAIRTRATWRSRAALASLICA